MAEELHRKGMSNGDYQKILRFLIITDKMKSIYRQTLLADKSRRETDAEHSFSLALMAMLFSPFAPEGTNIDRVIKMVLCHDLVEIYAGDTFCYDEEAKKDKKQRESDSADRLFSILPEETGKELKNLWLEFDEEKTPDSIFAASLDKFQPLINNFLTDGHTWKMGKVKREQVEQRVELVRKGFPQAWKTINDILDDSERKGFFNSL